MQSSHAVAPLTLHGPGRSRNTASAAPCSSSGNPSCSMFLWSTVTSSPRPLRANSSRARSARCSWNSKVSTRPVGATARANDVVSEPLPVPLSKTVHPGRSSSCAHTMAMSARYRIWVLWRNTMVHSSGVGASRCTQPCPVLERTLLPYAFPTHSCSK